MDGSRLRGIVIDSRRYCIFWTINLNFLIFSSSILFIPDFHWSGWLFAFSFLRTDFGMIRSKIGSKIFNHDKVLICDLCAVHVWMLSLQRFISLVVLWHDWLEPSIRESIVTAGKWLLKASWNFKMRKSSRINASEHHIIKQKQRSCQSHVMTHDQNLDSNFWVMLVRLIERSPVRRLQCVRQSK